MGKPKERTIFEPQPSKVASKPTPTQRTIKCDNTTTTTTKAVNRATVRCSGTRSAGATEEQSFSESTRLRPTKQVSSRGAPGGVPGNENFIICLEVRPRESGGKMEKGDGMARVERNIKIQKERKSGRHRRRRHPGTNTMKSRFVPVRRGRREKWVSYFL